MNKHQIWKPSILDETCRRMVISTSWVYRIHLEEQRLRDSIQKLLSIYPILGGRVNNDDVIFPSGDIHFEYLHRKGSAENLIGKNTLSKKYEAKFDLKKMLKGCFPLVSIKITGLAGGSILSISASHLLMDGRCFYRITNTLMSIYSGEIPDADIVFDDSVIPQINLPDSLDTSMFYPIPKTALLSVIWKKFYKPRKKRILIKNDEIMKIKNKAGVSRTAVLSAMVYEIMGRKAISIVQTADHRRHVEAISPNYGGNAASTLFPIDLIADLSAEEAARIIDDGIKRYMKDDEKHFPEYLYLLRNKLPYLPFPLGDAWKRNPDCIICNSFISFGIYDEMAAGGAVPAYAFPPDLPDPVRFFPAPPEEDGIYILLNL